MLHLALMSKKKADSDADQAARLVKVLAEATDAFGGDAEKAHRWLRPPVQHLGGRTPMEMLAIEGGTAPVRESIGAIAYGGVG